MAVWPSEFLMVMSTVPGSWAGVVAMTCVEFITVTEVALTPPNLTVVVLLKPLPVTTTLVPPSEGPEVGETESAWRATAKTLLGGDEGALTPPPPPPTPPPPPQAVRKQETHNAAIAAQQISKALRSLQVTRISSVPPSTSGPVRLAARFNGSASPACLNCSPRLRSYLSDPLKSSLFC